MEIREMDLEQLSQRAKELVDETENATEERLAEINTELDAIEERKSQLEAQAETRKRAADAVASGEGQPIPTPVKETRNMEEIRNTQAYIEAYAEYIKTGDETECRTLLSENVDNPAQGSSGPVPVPEFIENRVKTAWENDEIFGRINKTFAKGNLKVGFEISATDAAIHKEGANAPNEEELVMGIVTMTPDNIKKWIKVSDIVLDMGAEDMLTYLYDELTYKIIQKAASLAVAVIATAPTTSTSTKVGVPKIGNAADATAVIKAKALLGDEADDICAIMNRATEAAIKAGAIALNYQLDPFDGATVLHKNTLPAYADAEDGDVYMIVGDLKGVQANLPNGADVKFVFDELTYAESDLVKIVGKLLAAIEVTGPGMFVNVVKGDVESES